MNFYNISQAPTRLQAAQHFHSSLEEPTLENVEAQLFVARQRNYQLSLSYFQNKYGSSEIYNQYVENNSLEGLGAPKQQQYDLRRELEKQAAEIHERETRKIQERKGLRPDPDSNGQSERGRGGKDKKRTNIWAENKAAQQKPHPVQVQPEIKESNVYEINITREKEGNFMSDFKSYLSNKRKAKEEPHKSRTLEQSFNASQLKNASSLSHSKSQAKDKDRPKYEEELVKKIVKDIAGKCDSSTKIEKMQLIEYLNVNQKIIKVLNVSLDQLSRNIINFPTKDANLMSFNQTLMFVLSALGKADDVKKLRAQEEFQQVPQGCMLSKELLNLFQQTFRGMDRHNDLIIKRIPFIARLTNDPIVKKSLNLPAVFQPEYARHVSLRRILQRIQIQTLLCSQQERRLSEYISWNQFISYFQSGHKQRAKYDLIILLESLRNEEKFGLAHLPESVFEIINWGIKKADHGEELLSTIEILNEIKLHREYEIEKFTFIKSMGQDSSSEIFQDILVRVKSNAMKFVTPKEFLEYFSIRGKPIEDFQKERNEQQSKNLSAIKVTFIQNELFQQAAEPNGYDSDPEIYNNSKLHEKANESMRQSQKQFKRFKATAQSFIEPEEREEQQDDENPKQFKLTIPQPFSFEEREKERKANRLQQSPSKSQDQKFRAAPVPSSVLEVGLFEKMMEQQRKKNDQRKKCSMIMTLANEKPFSFLNRKVNKKTKEERQQFAFKAKPIPWFCSVDLLKKKEEAEILRNERIAKLAQQNLAKAKLPPRMEKDFLEKQAKKVLLQNSNKRPASSQARVKEPPNFDRLHREFEQALQRKRKQNKKTEICQFKFSNNQKSSSKVIPEKVEQQPIKRGEIPASLKSNIDVFAQSTAKFTQQVEKRRQETEQKRREEARKKKEEEERLKIDAELKQKVQDAARKNKQNKEKQEQEKRKEEVNRQNQTFQQWKKGCVQRGRKQPLLIDRVSKRDEKIEKMKRLYEISQTLKKNGITGKEHDHYFKRQELLLLQDYKQLIDKL